MKQEDIFKDKRKYRFIFLGRHAGRTYARKAWKEYLRLKKEEEDAQ